MHALLTTSFSAVLSMHIYCTCVFCSTPIRLEISWENIQNASSQENVSQSVSRYVFSFNEGVKGSPRHPGLQVSQKWGWPFPLIRGAGRLKMELSPSLLTDFRAKERPKEGEHLYLTVLNPVSGLIALTCTSALDTSAGLVPTLQDLHTDSKVNIRT